MNGERAILIRNIATEARENVDVLIDGTTVTYFPSGREGAVVAPSPVTELEGGGALLLPGIVDPHVHVRDFDLSAKEDWESASAAALRGGVTTVFDMPNTKPPTQDRASLDAKRQRAAAVRVRSRFFLGATRKNSRELRTILEEGPRDVAGVKIYLTESNSADQGWTEETLTEVFQAVAPTGYRIAVHAEMANLVGAEATLPGEDLPAAVRRHRPRQAAVEATRLVIGLAERAKARLHICHVSTAEELPLIRAAKGSVDLSCEVCYHHLFLTEATLNVHGALARVNPPLRTEADRGALLQAVADGTFDCVGSDHAPHTVEEKSRADFWAAPAGIGSLDIELPLIYQLVVAGVVDLPGMVRLTSEAPRRIFAPAGRAVDGGPRADFVLFDPRAETLVRALDFASKAKWSPYEGLRLPGRVRRVILDGAVIDPWKLS